MGATETEPLWHLSGGDTVVLECWGYLSVLQRGCSDSSWRVSLLSAVLLNCDAQKAVVSAAWRSSWHLWLEIGTGASLSAQIGP